MGLFDSCVFCRFGLCTILVQYYYNLFFTNSSHNEVPFTMTIQYLQINSFDKLKKELIYKMGPAGFEPATNELKRVKPYSSLTH